MGVFKGVQRGFDCKDGRDRQIRERQEETVVVGPEAHIQRRNDRKEKFVVPRLSFL